ncbi:methylated-DNA--[protein]-cysteine S-methyltransferase [Vibrio cidicii]|uniref:methylated-DNA--[protein]-cysteine S-methyltransferase n=1 Tax=Vibrio navarrensis TaxID=29495 RepID=UPI0013027142|nr:methylated-DNA--[protein]-cysteine S-methyltransferase [Vibrio navarrensis]EJN6826575.1 methylated-DNA--[protein]-cysteine S-methyltransferase [Vibrio cidicii]
MNYYTIAPSPLGEMTLQANDEGILGIWFTTQTTRPDDLGQEDANHPVLGLALTQLNEYFSGKRTQFDLPIAAKGTAFQMQVWQALTTIPYGETWSYQELANAIGNPKAVRAVGLANGKNPVSIVVPCHRVIGKNGKLTGYAGGIERKRWLLERESNQGR